MKMRILVVAADERNMAVEGTLEANRMFAGGQAAEKNEASGMIFTHPSKVRQAESPFLYLSNIITSM
jgi:hypothetical protein